MAPSKLQSMARPSASANVSLRYGDAWMVETVKTLKATAVQATGFTDFGGDWFERPLAAWVEDLAGASLKESGRSFLARLAVTNLSRRLEVVDWWNRNRRSTM